MKFSDMLSDWTDADGAAFRLAVALGALAPNADFTQEKWRFWTDNPLGNGLHAALVALVDAGLLESQDDEIFRWKPVD
jgi:hypothetical protein